MGRVEKSFFTRNAANILIVFIEDKKVLWINNKILLFTYTGSLKVLNIHLSLRNSNFYWLKKKYLHQGDSVRAHSNGNENLPQFNMHFTLL